MKNDRIKNNEEIRKKRNEDLIKRMREGDSLKGYDAQSSWFPPRPIIQKDKDLIKTLYDNQNYGNSSSYEIEPKPKKEASKLRLVDRK